MIKEYCKHCIKRAAQRIPPKPIDSLQILDLIECLKNPICGKEEFLFDLFINRVPGGVDEAAYFKAKFLNNIVIENIISPLISIEKAVELLGTMGGGYNIKYLIDLLDHTDLAVISANILKRNILIFDYFNFIQEKFKFGNVYSKNILLSWSNSEWFFNSVPVREKITVTVFKVTGETNTDDLSPVTDAWSRPDIPLHALSMLKYTRDGIIPDIPGSIGPIKQIRELSNKGFPLAYVGDIVGTGSSRKSAINSILWFIGKDIPYTPNKKTGGVVLGGKIAPIFFHTLEDSGVFPIEVDVSNLNMGDIIDIYPFQGKIKCHHTNVLLVNFTLKNNVLLDEIRVGGRIFLIIGNNLTIKAKKALNFNKFNTWLN